MRLFQPTTVDDAIGLLNDETDAKFLAGGQTLVAMINADLIEPDALISLKNVAELQGIIRLDDGAVQIGAMVTHAALASFESFTPAQALIGKAAQVIAHPAVRNAGTIGGAIAHADPAADYPAPLVVAEAIINVAGPDGRRAIPVEEFFVDYLETSLAEDEIVISIELPPGPDDAVILYDKISRVDGDFATLSLALLAVRYKSGFSALRIALGSAGPTAVRDATAEACLVGRKIEPADLDEAGRILSAACDPIDDIRGSTAYRLKLVPRILARAVETVLGA